MDNDQEFAAPEDREITGGGEPEVPEDETPNDGDAEGDDGDNGEDAEEQDEPGPDSTEEPARGRASQRIQALNARTKEATDRAEKAERDMAALRAQMEEVQRSLHSGNAAKDAQAEAELLAQMDPIQRVQYEADKKINAIQVELRKVQLSNIDSADRATFLSKAQNDPVRTKLADQVEKNLSDMRAKGINAPRDDIYYYLLGKQLAEAKTKSGGKGPVRQEARSRVETTQGRTTSSRSDAPSGRKGKTAEDRLENVLL